VIDLDESEPKIEESDEEWLENLSESQFNFLRDSSSKVPLKSYDEV
jgi:hypothetical protein